MKKQEQPHLIRVVTFSLLVLAMLAAPAVAFAESDSWATLGASGRVTWQAPGETPAAQNDIAVHLGLRGELFYVFGAEFEYTPVPENQRADIYRPSMRLTGHLHLVNSHYFDLHLGVGLASAGFGDLINPEGDTTLYRAGAGMEFIISGHWAIGVDTYWSTAGLGHFNKRLRASLQDETEGFPNPADQLSPTQLEAGLALRYYL